MSPSSDTEIRIPSNPPEDAVHPQTRRKRGSVSSLGSTSNGVQGANHRRKSLKVTRACDHCKKRKAKCSGTLPCNKCSGKGLECLYDAQYSRGRPPTPPPFLVSQHVATDSVAEGLSLGAGEAPLLEAPRARSYLHAADGMPRVDSGLASRASPELDLTEVQGQVFDPTSGLAFLHRARKRLAKRQAHGAHSDGLDNSHRLDGDRPLPKAADNDICKLSLPSHDELKALMALYFDVCIATYRIIHRPTVDSWLHVVERNLEQGAAIWQDLGYARASIVLACLSVAMFHQDRKAVRNLSEDEAASLSRSDRLFCASVQLVEMEAGLPRLDIAQARIIQTLYLLTSSRMNRAWETFGHVLQLVSALGMHRKESRKRHLTKTPLDYLQSQLRMRTFWTVYILDKYLGVIFGRPQHYHDDDIDQDFPDALEDEDITVQGPAISPGVEQLGCHIDALICNVKIARIIGKVSHEVYSIKAISEDDRLSAARRINIEIQEWKMSLPLHLGSIQPSMLVISFRRQSIALKLAHAHALMHANRPFLLAKLGPESKAQVDECIGAARSVMEIVDGFAIEGSLFHALWWTQYVTFCALVVFYVWDIRIKRRAATVPSPEQGRHSGFMKLAHRCQIRLAEATATNSPSRKYAVILEEFCSEAMGSGDIPKFSAGDRTGRQLQQPQPQLSQQTHGDANPVVEDSYRAPNDQGDTVLGGSGENGHFPAHSFLDQWDTNDWIDLDSSAFGPWMAEMDSQSLNWIPDMGV